MAVPGAAPAVEAGRRSVPAMGAAAPRGGRRLCDVLLNEFLATSTRRQKSVVPLMMLTLLFVIGDHSGLKGRAAPIGPPNLSSCASTCCLPVPTSAATAFARNTSIPFHTRLSLQTAIQNTAFVTKLRTAYGVLRNLTRTAPNDPRGFEQQRIIHCAFCSSPLAYGNNFQVHGSWYFLPWHRMYLYYHERILAWACRDSAFALPYWNWDNTAGRPFPAPYTITTSSLYTSARASSSSIASGVLAATSRTIMRESILNTVTQTGFFGGTLSSGQPGSAESRSHNGVHSAVGRSSDGREMGRFDTAALDPIFYNHHCNIDRLWFLWLRMPTTPSGARANPSSSDWRGSRYTFYDETARAKTIAVSDVLDHKGNLRYTYEDVTNDWLSASELPGPARRRRSLLQETDSAIEPPQNLVMGGAFDGASSGAEGRRRLMQAPSSDSSPPASTAPAAPSISPTLSVPVSPSSSTGPLSVNGGAISVNFSAPTTGRGGASRGTTPILTIKEATFNAGSAFAMHVFIDEPFANLETPREGNPHYVTTIYTLAGGPSSLKITPSVSLLGALADNGLTEQSPITVQLVPGFSPRPLSIKSLEYLRVSGP